MTPLKKRIEVRQANYPGFGQLPGFVPEKIKFPVQAQYVEKSLTQKQKEDSLHKLNCLKKGNIFCFRRLREGF
ncbi:MAG: hypothetical protein CVU54_09010 [Deltaproteobacteria bacterium HGW-Deltaproteobacteria-12]|jgi:hypothetical protein|nr:MAG: hypothetical protein CVU54_09010 [Deltaproteobacteria bacterium HGW-Deltaproteobacteria-12]